MMFNDTRFWTVGSYCKKVLERDPKIEILAHGRIPEDVGLCEHEPLMEQTDLVMVIDSSTHYKIHHGANILKKYGVKTCFWVSDTHRPDWASWRLQMMTEWRYDYIFVCQKDAIEMVKNCGYSEDQIVWLPHAVDTEIFRYEEQFEKRYDVATVGFRNEKRDKYFPELHKVCEFKEGINLWAWSASRLYNESKIGLNLSVTNDYLNMRTFEVPACKIPLVTNINRNNDNGFFEIFKDEEDCLVYENVDEMKEVIVRLLCNPDLYEKIKHNAYAKILAHHSYKNRCNTMLATMGYEMLA